MPFALEYGCRTESQLRTSGRADGMADISEVLWNDYLRHNPANPKWPDRDRFVLSNGHGSMLLYSLLHLTAMTCRSKSWPTSANCTPRPRPSEYGYAPGVETTLARWTGHHQRRRFRHRERALAGSSTDPATTSSITTPMYSSATAA